MPQNAAPPLVVLTIAGFDPSGGAGMTADLAVFAAHGLYGTSAVTVLTAQSTEGVAATRPADPAFLLESLTVLASDLPPAGVKIGALGTAANVDMVARFLDERPFDDTGKLLFPSVLDPVLLSSSGHWLLDRDALPALRDRLLSRVGWVTPNWPEVAALSGCEVRNREEAWRAAHVLAGDFPGLNVVVTGGDQEQAVDLVLEASGTRHELAGEHIASRSTHGTGCAFSSALLAGLVLGQPAIDAARAAKRFVAEGIRRAPGLGRGRGPLDLFWPLRDRNR